ncbi:MAG TPA: hypothetical protein VGH84_08030, partial [Steroidobacteraceae bacterium]
MSEMPLSSLPLDPHEPGGAIQPNLPQRTPGCEKCGLEEFRNYQQDLIVGASLAVTAPTGQYDASR